MASSLMADSHSGKEFFTMTLEPSLSISRPIAINALIRFSTSVDSGQERIVTTPFETAARIKYRLAHDFDVGRIIFF